MELVHIVIVTLIGVQLSYGQFLNPACPSLTEPCTTFYTIDANGCRVCVSTLTSILNTATNPGGDPLHQGFGQIGTSSSAVAEAPPYNNEFIEACVTGSTCDLRCDIGYLNGPSNECQYCICATVGTTAYTSPCPTAASTCDLPCAYGFMKTDAGCQYCECVPAPTAAPVPTKVTISAEECTMKIMNCQILHPFGFMTDDECEMCIGKDEIYAVGLIPEERQPVIQLSNPCIKNFDRCMIICRTGYRTGPRNCQYCACNN